MPAHFTPPLFGLQTRPSTTAADRIRCFPFSLRVVLSRDITDGLLSESNALHNLSAAVVLGRVCKLNEGA
jgi:hypothetical protein